MKVENRKLRIGGRKADSLSHSWTLKINSSSYSLFRLLFGQVSEAYSIIDAMLDLPIRSGLDRIRFKSSSNNDILWASRPATCSIPSSLVWYDSCGYKMSTYLAHRTTNLRKDHLRQVYSARKCFQGEMRWVGEQVGRWADEEWEMKKLVLLTYDHILPQLWHIWHLASFSTTQVKFNLDRYYFASCEWSKQKMTTTKSIR